MENKDYPYNLLEAVFGSETAKNLGQKPEDYKDLSAGADYVMRGFPDHVRELLELRFKQGLSYSKIGEAMGQSRDVVRNEIERYLRRYFRDESDWSFLLYGLRGTFLREREQAEEEAYDRGFKEGYEKGFAEGMAQNKE